MYKNVYFFVDVFSVKIPCYFAIPPDLNKERLVNFGISDKKEIQITFPIEVQASYPIFKEGTSIFAGNRMENIISNLYLVSEKEDDKDSAGRNIKVTRDTWPTGNNSGSFYTD